MSSSVRDRRTDRERSPREHRPEGDRRGTRRRRGSPRGRVPVRRGGGPPAARLAADGGPGARPAGCLSAGAGVLQRLPRGRAGAGAPDGLTGSLPGGGVVTKLLHEPLWLLGWGVNLLGFLVQAGALHLGSVALVQPVLTTQ